MNDKQLLKTLIATLVVAISGLFLQAWILGHILSWFGVALTFWQNFTIIILANLIFKNGGSSK